MTTEIKARFITDVETARILGISPQTLRNDRHLGRGLPYHKYGRAVRYFEPEIFDYMHMSRIVPEAGE